jgi:acyl-CoA reductase-like NAD-dependent aldehyde dehydrogenase
MSWHKNTQSGILWDKSTCCTSYLNPRNDLHRIPAFIEWLDVGTVNIWEAPGYRIEMSPFGGIKDSGNGVKDGVLEAMKFFTHVKTCSFPWPE